MSYRAYGGGYRGRGGRGGRGGGQHWQQTACEEDMFRDPSNFNSGSPYAELRNYFNSVEGVNYGELKSLTNASFALSETVRCTFLAIQSDPFAPGSQVRMSCPCPFQLQKILQCSELSSCVPCRRIAAEDYILRSFHDGHRRGVARHHSGALHVMRPSQHVLERSTVVLVNGDREKGGVEVHLFARVKLPGHGRRIDGHGAIRIFYDELLPIMERCVVGLDEEALYQHVTCVHDQEHLRGELRAAGCVAFVANGSVLPRESGNSDRPLGKGAVPFVSPASLERTFHLPHSGATVTGMGLPHGLILIAGGGFHGKSTLLRALEVGIYNHVPDDGRVYVTVDPTAVKIRAEDRRSINGVDISPFINNLPFQKTTTSFVTSDASGSTSQAANIMEALELGSRLLLLDEDTCATNLMYRDDLMQQLVPREQEPITPFVDRVTDLIQNHGVSSIMVIGGSGQYFPHATVTLVMNAYKAFDCSESAKEISRTFMSSVQPPQKAISVFVSPMQRQFDGSGTFSTVHCRRGHDSIKVSGVGVDSIRFAEETIDLSLVEQIVEEGQVNAIAQCLAMLYDGEENGIRTILAKGKSLKLLYSPSGGSEPRNVPFYSEFAALIEGCDAALRDARLEARTPSCYLPRGFTSAARRFEIGAALNRLRTLRTLTAAMK
ncbi:putative mitochondrial RNA binding complex 1 subunit [Trypanosoma cruzi]|uniref:Mitochondrial RNA binding complex 1 subunit n=2 Tax=Trypanosoma cruzi TaxID=5693 RepID=V5BHU4_TRYCR|nr:hypothetical protein TCDM_03925 [Trypanosoma cruzi Dm28c]KAF8282252.1 putative mitochondrial RNA binding complex 1 subunit [Trypanosoma cruzi]PBJ73785.1 mitochondrial RNA binding complex 1 subunit [Trypanosoma cruzi cruzi]PWU98723.1 putative mitochondrial RNA binding complex 1 subunit [Trypanosoma cruzi]RNF17121.1 putative mitochondrial RNA binding complex 1 subunit [Trypanosoma cruzi]